MTFHLAQESKLWTLQNVSAALPCLWSPTALSWEMMLYTTPHDSMDVWYWVCHLFSQIFFPALYEKLPRKMQKGEQREEDTSICKRQGTAKGVRGPQLERWGEALRCPGCREQHRVYINTKMCVTMYVHWDLGVPGNSRDSKLCQSNFWTIELRTNKRIFKLYGETCRSLGEKEVS